MWWLMTWVLLVLLSGVYIGARAWGLWGQTKELGSELVIAERRIGDVQRQMEALGEKIGEPTELAVFSSPVSARKERERALAAGRRARRARRAVSHPSVAKHVD